jgi:hypothetical protein
VHSSRWHDLHSYSALSNGVSWLAKMLQNAEELEHAASDFAELQPQQPRAAKSSSPGGDSATLQLQQQVGQHSTQQRTRQTTSPPPGHKPPEIVTINGEVFEVVEEIVEYVETDDLADKSGTHLAQEHITRSHNRQQQQQEQQLQQPTSLKACGSSLSLNKAPAQQPPKTAASSSSAHLPSRQARQERHKSGAVLTRLHSAADDSHLEGTSPTQPAAPLQQTEWTPTPETGGPSSGGHTTTSGPRSRPKSRMNSPAAPTQPPAAAGVRDAHLFPSQGTKPTARYLNSVPDKKSVKPTPGNQRTPSAATLKAILEADEGLKDMTHALPGAGNAAGGRPRARVALPGYGNTSPLAGGDTKGAVPVARPRSGQAAKDDKAEAPGYGSQQLTRDTQIPPTGPGSLPTLKASQGTSMGSTGTPLSNYPTGSQGKEVSGSVSEGSASSKLQSHSLDSVPGNTAVSPAPAPKPTLAPGASSTNGAEDLNNFDYPDAAAPAQGNSPALVGWPTAPPYAPDPEPWMAVPTAGKWLIAGLKWSDAAVPFVCAWH